MFPYIGCDGWHDAVSRQATLVPFSVSYNGIKFKIQTSAQAGNSLGLFADQHVEKGQFLTSMDFQFGQSFTIRLPFEMEINQLYTKRGLLEFIDSFLPRKYSDHFKKRIDYLYIDTDIYKDVKGSLVLTAQAKSSKEHARTLRRSKRQKTGRKQKIYSRFLLVDPYNTPLGYMNSCFGMSKRACNVEVVGGMDMPKFKTIKDIEDGSELLFDYKFK